MSGSGTERVSAATLGLARLASVASLLRAVSRWEPKVLFHGAILQTLGHPGLDMLVKLAAIDTTLLALLLSDQLPRGLQSIWTESSGVERHFSAVDGAIDDIEVGGAQSETA